MSSIVCHACGSCMDLHSNVKAFRGRLINEISSLGSELVTTKERITQLRSQRFSKQFKKQHEQTIETINKLERSLAIAEGRRRGLMFFKKEFCDL